MDPFYMGKKYLSLFIKSFYPSDKYTDLLYSLLLSPALSSTLSSPSNIHRNHQNSPLPQSFLFPCSYSLHFTPFNLPPSLFSPLICTSPFSFSFLHERNPLFHQIMTHILLPLFLCTPTVLFWPGVHYSRFWRKVFIIHGVHKGGYYGKVFNVHIPQIIHKSPVSQMFFSNLAFASNLIGIIGSHMYCTGSFTLLPWLSMAPDCPLLYTPRMPRSHTQPAKAPLSHTKPR